MVLWVFTKLRFYGSWSQVYPAFRDGHVLCPVQSPVEHVEQSKQKRATVGRNLQSVIIQRRADWLTAEVKDAHKKEPEVWTHSKMTLSVVVT